MGINLRQNKLSKSVFENIYQYPVTIYVDIVYIQYTAYYVPLPGDHIINHHTMINAATSRLCYIYFYACQK